MVFSGSSPALVFPSPNSTVPVDRSSACTSNPLPYSCKLGPWLMANRTEQKVQRMCPWSQSKNAAKTQTRSPACRCRIFSCTSEAACWGRTPCGPAGLECIHSGAEYWGVVWWTHVPHWCTSASTPHSGCTKLSWCDHGRSSPAELKNVQLVTKTLVE